jgi:site-specific DNA recombinase
MKAYGYVRLSKETVGTTSPQRQRERIQEVCAQKGWDLVEIFEDIDVSAFRAKHRPEFSRMMSRLGDTDAIVFWKLDRLSRSSVEAGQIADRAKAANVDLVATDGMPIDTTSAGGKFVYTVLAAAGEMEANQISERSRSMMRFKRRNDEWVGRVPFGFRLVKKHLEVDQHQMAVLAKAAKRYVAGETFSAVARDLGFQVGPLIRMLKSERVQDALPDELQTEFFHAASARKLSRVPTSSQSLLGGIAACGVCGKAMVVSSTRGGRQNGRWHQYRCSETGHVGISAPWLDDYVSAQVLDAIDTGKLLAAIRRGRKRPRSRKASEIEARMEFIDEQLGAGRITQSRYDRMNADLVERLAAAQKAETAAGIDLPAELARNLTKRWPDLDIGTQRRIIRAVVEKIEVGKASGHGPVDQSRVELTWRA